MANWKLLRDGELVNTIVADKVFAYLYADAHGYTVEEIPESTPVPSKQREKAYNTDTIIFWNGEMITVTEASLLWQYYAAEGSEKASELQALIAEAKNTIREKYPDEEVYNG